MNTILDIKKIGVQLKETDVQIIHELSLAVQAGEVHVIMGPNGSGKSTLVNALMGHPRYRISSGSMVLAGEDITQLKTNEKAKKGLFLSMQYQPEIAGVTITNFLRTAVASMTDKKINPITFHKQLITQMDLLGIDPAFALRYVNKGCSGGEKKRLEMLQLLMLQPRFAFLDEIDSGLDVDAFKVVASAIKLFQERGGGVVLVTHYNRILEYIMPDKVHVMISGALVASGDKRLADEIEKHGYDTFKT